MTAKGSHLHFTVSCIQLLFSLGALYICKWQFYWAVLPNVFLLMLYTEYLLKNTKDTWNMYSHRILTVPFLLFVWFFLGILGMESKSLEFVNAFKGFFFFFFGTNILVLSVLKATVTGQIFGTNLSF
jgi:hypothetical protein